VPSQNPILLIIAGFSQMYLHVFQDKFIKRDYKHFIFDDSIAFEMTNYLGK